MYLLISKIIFASGILLLTIITGLIPLRVVKHDIRFLSLCDAFASGVFLSTALLHLLPEATTKISITYDSNYPLAYLICIATYVTFITIERGIFIKIVAPSFLVLLLSIHSLIEGAAIGINTNFFETLTIFFAVFAHKGSESFALTVNLHRFGLSIKKTKQIITIFSFITPLGIFIASYIIYATTTNFGISLNAYLNAIAAGTFLYLGAEHLFTHKKTFEKIGEIAALIFGVTLMAVVAVWV